MKPLARNAFSYCKAVINVGLLLVAGSSTLIFFAGYGYFVSETQFGPQPEGLDCRLLGNLLKGFRQGKRHFTAEA